MHRRRTGPLFWLLLPCVVLAAAMLAMFWEARRMPVVRTATVSLAAYPRGQKPVRIALLSDIHMSGPDMDPAKLSRIVDMVNAQRPDIVLLAGDYHGDKKWLGEPYALMSGLAPLARIDAPLGTVAVFGNHDVGGRSRAVVRAFRRLGITLLDNQAEVRGPLAIGGVGDDFSGHADLGATMDAMAKLPGLPLIFTHSPDVFARLRGPVPLVLAGHTHCGQVMFPFLPRPPWLPSHIGGRYVCGRYDEGGRTLIVSAGLGTSGVPLRMLAPPDFWIVTVKGAG